MADEILTADQAAAHGFHWQPDTVGGFGARGGQWVKADGTSVVPREFAAKSDPTMLVIPKDSWKSSALQGLAAAGAAFGGAALLGAGAGGGASTAASAGASGGTTAAAGGGALGTLGSVAKIAGPAAAAMSSNRAAARGAEAENARASDAEDLQRAKAEQQAAVDAITTMIAQQKDSRDAYQTNAKNAVQGGALRGVQDVHIDGLPAGVTMGHVTGGNRPSAIVNKEQIGQQVQNDAMEGLLHPSSPTQLPAFKLPPKQSLPEPNAFDTFLNILGPVATGIGAYGTKKSPTLPPPGNAAAGQNLMGGVAYDPKVYQVPRATQPATYQPPLAFMPRNGS